MNMDIETIQDVVLRERKLAVSDREWKHRLRGYGFSIRDTEAGAFVTSLVKGNDICALPV